MRGRLTWKAILGRPGDGFCGGAYDDGLISGDGSCRWGKH